ncbi:MAG TPA: family 10 glycosylhydrolase [Mucilaginibacter sp.]|nr:family 10 glycosylhydrolase [Mucilaginibacter sp.]
MRVSQYFLFLLSTLAIVVKASAQNDTQKVVHADTPHVVVKVPKLEPKREFRGEWIATVVNIDWPSDPNLPVEKQKEELINILDADQRAGINAVMLQVRPAADAFYAKSSEPWSKWLTGKQGQAPDPMYDPLQFAITEAHKRGIELHAWFNPYRATFDHDFKDLCSCHITNQEPGWFFTYGGIKLFNPGLPEVRNYIVKVILNVVDNYDIDGVHMDDYFYPYQIQGQHIHDEQAFKEYGSGFDNIDDWRRNNVDLLIHMLSDSIHKHKSYVKFGISPFGIWKNIRQDPGGSETSGGDSYYELYADTRKWVKEGWVDYIAPQIYWNLGYRLAPFENLVDWWSDNTYGRHLYVGQAAYRINDPKSKAFRNPAEVPDQIRYLRDNPRVEGSIFFSANSLMHDPLGFTDSLRNNFYKYPALPPQMLWLDSVPPNAPKNLVVTTNSSGVNLQWQTPDTAKDKQTAYGYVVYRFNGTDTVNLSNPKNIIHIQYDTSTQFEDETAAKGHTYLYIITSLDRLKNESEPTPTVAITTN